MAKLKPFQQRVEDIIIGALFTDWKYLSGELKQKLEKARNRIAEDMEFFYKKTPGAVENPTVEEMLAALRFWFTVLGRSKITKGESHGRRR